VNAGGTKQKGAELQAAYSILSNPSSFFSLIRLWSAFTYNDFIFTNYKIDDTDHSGKELTGVPKYVSVTGLDFTTTPGFYLHTSFNHTSRHPLNDANEFYGDAYNLLQAKIGWKRQISPGITMELYAGADNILDETYSLGNDINAFGRRYFNPSPLRNYFGGLVIGF
jgi:iron complex outermembrane receptor protein